MWDFEDGVAAATVPFLPFVAVMLIAWAIEPPTPEQLAAADPLIQLVGAWGGSWLVPVVCVAPPLAWAARRPPTRAGRHRAVTRAAGAVVIVTVGLLGMRLMLGPSLPGFVPPEESARPGLVLGLGAGLLEEAAFRFGVLAPAYLAARRVWPEGRAVTAAVVVTAVLFAASHEIGPGAGPFELRYFLTRLVVPGTAMSLLFFRPGPAFLVSLHAAAHVGIAVLFSGPPR